MHILGIDPDLHNTAWATLDGEGVWEVGVWRVPPRITGPQAVIEMAEAIYLPPTLHADIAVVENQEHYVKGTASPDSIKKLAQVAGVCIGCLAESGCVDKILFPLPKEWKGQVPKTVHHKRISMELGWEYYVDQGKVLPEDRRDLPNSDWFHVWDAIGLVLWAKNQK